MYQHEEGLVNKWAPVLEGVSDDYTKRVTAQLLENQAKSIVSERLDEALSDGATTTGKLGTFQKFAFPLVRRVYPKLIANMICGVQPMQGPVSQVFYLGASRAKAGGGGANEETIFSKVNLTYKGLSASGIGSDGGAVPTTDGGTFDQAGTGGLDGDDAQSTFDVSNVLDPGNGGDEVIGRGAPSGTVGGQIASWPETSSILGFSLSAGERLANGEIPEMNFHIQQQAVVARTRKMRALWTLEASQDLKAYHNLDLERELTDLLSKELQLEIDRELVEDLRMIAYGFNTTDDAVGGWDGAALDQPNANSFGSTGGTGGDSATKTAGAAGGAFVPAAFQYDFTTGLAAESQNKGSNIFVHDFTTTALGLAPRHVGEVYANLLAVINFASQDIYRTTMRGPGTWLLTSPLVASMLESAAKLEGGLASGDGPSNVGKNNIEYKGKFAGKYDLYVDPMYPTDEIMVGYKGSNAMDSGFVYAPYIPLQQLPTITDPETFQPRKGILTRYGKVAVTPQSRFYRIVRLIGPTANYLLQPFARNKAFQSVGGLDYA
jgi:hypothetical protein